MMPAVLEIASEICLGPVEAIPPGEGRTYCVEGERLAVFRGRDGSLRAVQAECPHRGGPLAEGITGSGAVICPLHSWQFDLETGACRNDPAHRLRTYPIRQDRGRLYVTVYVSSTLMQSTAW